MSQPLVLSLFPGIGLLDMAFELEGFCIVRGPDVLWASVACTAFRIATAVRQSDVLGRVRTTTTYMNDVVDRLFAKLDLTKAQLAYPSVTLKDRLACERNGNRGSTDPRTPTVLVFLLLRRLPSFPREQMRCPRFWVFFSPASGLLISARTVGLVIRSVFGSNPFAIAKSIIALLHSNLGRLFEATGGYARFDYFSVGCIARGVIRPLSFGVCEWHPVVR